MTNINHFLLFFVFLFIFCSFFAQNPKINELTTLDEAVTETSGLLFYNNKLWTHNDSGNKPILYCIDSISGKVLKQKVIKNAKNSDWEDIAKDFDYAYIGDFGNNNGKRDFFVIYRIKLSDLDAEIDTIKSKKIIFFYDTTYYKPNSKNAKNFDCEAMIVKNDSIFLFTKNWENYKTYLFSIPKSIGKYTAKFCDSLDVKGLITGADYNPTTNSIALIGYKFGINQKSFMVILSDFENNNFFKGKSNTYLLNLKGCQTEGIVFCGKSEFYISNEKFLRRKQSLFKIFF
ncbi:MAG: hypothetical protein LBV69_08690 [Bacteroidales bacterium]|jgi:hypothetical protein|nr:hypothetical protein [Bacteroidales bacterium]